MTEEYDPIHDLILVSKADSRVMRTIGWFWPAFMTSIWTTWRWWWQAKSRCYFPPGTKNSAQNKTLNHEGEHGRQQRPIWHGGYGVTGFAVVYFFPIIPYLSWGRVVLEAPAYAIDVHEGRLSPDGAVNTMSSGTYFWPAPKFFVRWKLGRSLRRLSHG
jgi:hypothetical protein